MTSSTGLSRLKKQKRRYEAVDTPSTPDMYAPHVFQGTSGDVTVPESSTARLSTCGARPRRRNSSRQGCVHPRPQAGAHRCPHPAQGPFCGHVADGSGPGDRPAHERALAPQADFAHVSRSVAVTAFQSGWGLVNPITPTSAVIMGGLALSKVGYDRYLKFVWPFIAIAFVVVCVFAGGAAALS